MFMAMLKILQIFTDFPYFFIVFHHFPLIFALQTPFFHKGNEGGFKVKSVKNGSKLKFYRENQWNFQQKLLPISIILYVIMFLTY